MTVAYASFHLIDWNFTFPTLVELSLWRASSLVVTGTTLFFWIFETIAAHQRFGRWDKYLIWLRLKKPARPRVADAERNVDPAAADERVDPADAFEREQK